MSALHKCTQKKPNRLHWKQFFNAGYKRICQHFEQHNQRFPAGQHQPYSYAYPHRLKDSEMKTAINAFRQWCKQAAAQLAHGDPYITNVLRTNNRKLRENQDGAYGSKSTTPNHLAKLAYSGFFCGTEETKEELHPQQIYRHRDHGGKGFGWRPHKRFRGRKNDYELLINPLLLPTDLMPSQAVFVAKMDGFDAKVRALKSVDPPSPPLNQKLLPYQASHNSKRNKDMSGGKKVSAKADVCQEDGNLAEGSPQKAGNPPPEKQLFSTPIAAPAAKNAKNPHSHTHTHTSPLSLPAAFQLTHQNQKPIYYAQILIDLYNTKLATAMQRDYSSQRDKGFQSALELLNQIPEPELDDFHDRMIQVIDQQEKRLKLYPMRYVVGPARFFHPAEKYGILHYEKNWLQVYEKREIEFAEMAQARSRDAQALLQSEAEIAQQDKKWYFLAWRFKNALMQLHKHDMRLRKANLAHWERDIRLMVRKDGIPAKELIALMDWLLKGKKTNARWWRNEYGIEGIKSTSSLRKHYAKLHIAFQQDLANTEQAGKSIPRKQTGPKQIPRSGKIKNFRR